MKGQSKILVVLVVLFMLLNIWLLHTNYVRQDRIDNLLSLQNELFHKEIESNTWGYEQVGYESAVIIHPEVEIPKTGMSMAVFFTDRGCGYCVDHEVELLNQMHDKFVGKINVYLLSHNKSFLERLHDAEFPYTTIDPQKKLLNNDFNFGNPVATFIDKNGLVQIIHIAEKDNKNKSIQFYERMSSLLLSIKN